MNGLRSMDTGMRCLRQRVQDDVSHSALHDPDTAVLDSGSSGLREADHLAQSCIYRGKIAKQTVVIRGMPSQIDAKPGSISVGPLIGNVEVGFNGCRCPYLCWRVGHGLHVVDPVVVHPT